MRRASAARRDRPNRTLDNEGKLPKIMAPTLNDGDDSNLAKREFTFSKKFGKSRGRHIGQGLHTSETPMCNPLGVRGTLKRFTQGAPLSGATLGYAV